MAATLVLADHVGRLGNRLILYSHVLAAAEEYGCRVINLSILSAAHYFEGLHLNPLGEYPRRRFPLDLRWLFRSLRRPLQDWVRGCRGQAPVKNRWVTILDRENQPVYRLDSPEFADLTRRSKWIILWGYPYRCPPLVRKHREKIRAFFRIRPQAAPRLSREFAAARNSGKDTLAIHIRQGDFRSWNGGRFYISPREVAQALSCAGWNVWESGLRAWICSDECVPPLLFPPEATAGIPRSLGEDLYIMSHCRRLVSGWSTLSYFCAFLGDNEFYRVCTGQSRVERLETTSLIEA